MSDQKKRKRVASVDGQSANNVPRKVLKPTVDETEPAQPQRQPPPRPPDTAGFFKRISTQAKAASVKASGHAGYEHSVGLAEGFVKLKQPWSPNSEDNRVKSGHLSSADYEDGYISEDGDRFLNAIHAHKDNEIKGVSELEQAKKPSSSGNTIRRGNPTTARYHGVDIKFRVDFTEIAPKPEAATESQQAEQPGPTRWEPHARIYGFGKDPETKLLANFAQNIHTQGGEVEKQHFLEGVKGQAPPDAQISDAYATGVEFRAVGRASDAFGDVVPAFDGLLLSKPQTPQDVRNLFFHPEFETGALGHQNSGPGKTGDFNSFKEIVGNARVTHNTNLGTDIDTVSRIRKAKAINALVPTDSPIVDITIRPETK
jgi:hypothetical protein